VGATVVLVSLDGFRPDYLTRYDAPNLRALAAGGVSAPKGMIPVFPSKTFPNHYSLVTGLYPSRHGIVSNNMYDPDWDAWYRYRDPDAVTDGRWYGGEPIWVTAERQGLRSATQFWVGSEAAIGGLRPTFWKAYDGRVSGADRVDQVLRWLDLSPSERPSVVLLYFSEVDAAGHRHGPDSEQTAAAVRRVDRSIGRLVGGLEQRDRLFGINLIVVSDHGMAATSPDRVIRLADTIDLRDVRIVERSPLLMLRPKPGKLDSVHAALVGAHPRLTVYRREETPDRWHFRDHRRITPLVAVADEGWTVDTRRDPSGQGEFALGMHGYDNHLESMRALFLAHGPAFRRGVETESFDSIHLYELLSGLLKLEPAPNDGDPGALRHLLVDRVAR
jgi:predicted AlkP superfamily pyrophosphatase or phosphodiesterase